MASKSPGEHALTARFALSVLLVGTSVFGLGILAPAADAASSSLTRLPLLPGDTHGEALVINDAGQVVGSDASNSSQEAFTWTTTGGLIGIPPLPGDNYDTAWALSPNGVVAGISGSNAAGSERGYEWTAGGGIVAIGTLGGRFAYPNPGKYAINSSGEVVGYAQTSSGESDGFAWTPDGVMRDLVPLPGDVSSSALSVSDSGIVYGDSFSSNGTLHAVEWSPDGNVTDLGFSGPNITGSDGAGHFIGQQAGGSTGFYQSTAADGQTIAGLGGDEIDPTAQSSNGLVTGSGNSQPYTGPGTNMRRGFIWSSSQGTTPLGTLGGNYSTGIDVNNAGQVAGNSDVTADGSITHAFVWSATAGMTDLGALPGGNVSMANSINASGELAGVSNDSSGTEQPVVWDFPAAPVITSESSATALSGSQFSFVVTTSGYPAAKLTKKGTLPGGLKFLDNGDGTATISGTPTAASAGSHLVTVTAKNVGGSVSQNLTLTVQKAPTLTKIPNASGQAGSPLSIAISSKGSPPPALSTSALPAGLTLRDNGDGTGAIAGTPSAGTGGVYLVTVTATGVGSPASRSFTLQINETPAVTSANGASATVGNPFAFTFTATGYPAARFTLSGTLPKGINFKAASATLAGTPKAKTAGSYPVTVTAKNSAGTASQIFTLVVS